jgi:hypothetical protein
MLTAFFAGVFLFLGSSVSQAALLFANTYDGQDVYNTFWGSPGPRWTVNLFVLGGTHSVDRIDFFFGQSGGGVATPSAYVDILSAGDAVLGTSDSVAVTTAENSAYGITNLATIQSTYRMTFSFASPVSLLSGNTYGLRLSAVQNNQFNWWPGLPTSDSSFMVVDEAPLFELYGSGGAPVPEPGTWAAAALLIGTAGYVRWCRRAKVA